MIHLNEIRYSASAVFRGHITTNYMMAIAAYLLAHEFIERKSYRKYLGPLIALVITNIFMSDGRTGYLVFFALTLLFLWQHIDWRGITLGVLAIALMTTLAFFTSSHFQQRVKQIPEYLHAYTQGEQYNSIGLRALWYTTAFKLIKQNPLHGTGTGSLAHEFKQKISNPILLTRNPHNEYLNLGVQLGLPGLLLLLAIFYLQWHDSRVLTPAMRRLAQGILIATATGCLFNSLLMDSGEGHFYVFFIAIAFANYNPKHQQKSSLL